MSNSISLIKELTEHLSAYEKEVGNANLKEFSLFLKDRVVFTSSSTKSLPFEKDYKNYEDFPEIAFSTLLTGLFRYAKHYVKKAFHKVSFNTLDEFGFMATLLREGSLLKHQLIEKHIMGTSSGSEILKRLIKLNLIDQFTDDKDKRAKRVALTEEGRSQILIAFKDMHKVSEIIIGNLNSTELKEALVVFNKLKYFHNRIHESDKNATIDTIHEKYISSNT